VNIVVAIAFHRSRDILPFRCSRSVPPKVSVAKTRSVWVPKPLPAMHHVAGLILVPSRG